MAVEAFQHFTVRVPRDQMAAAKAKARREGKNLADIFREAFANVLMPCHVETTSTALQDRQSPNVPALPQTALPHAPDGSEAYAARYDAVARNRTAKRIGMRTLTDKPV